MLRLTLALGLLLSVACGSAHAACPVFASNNKLTATQLNNCFTGATLAALITTDPGFYHPGNESPVIQQGHFFPFLDRNFNFTADYFGFGSTDCTTVPIVLTVTGTVGSGGAVIGFTLQDLSGHTASMSYTTVNGDTTTTIAAALIAKFKANTTIAAIYAVPCPDGSAGTGIIANSFSSANALLFNQMTTFAQVSTSNIVTSVVNGGGSNLTLTPTWQIAYPAGLANALEINPVIVMERSVSARTAQVGDLIGQFLFVGKDNVGNDQQYGSIATVIENPSSATPIGNVQISSNTSAGGAFNVGAGVWDNASGTIFSSARDPGVGSLNIGNIGYYGTGSGKACYAFIGGGNNGQVGSGSTNCGLLMSSNGTGGILFQNGGGSLIQFTGGTLPADYLVFNAPNSGAITAIPHVATTTFQLGGNGNDIQIGTSGGITGGRAATTGFFSLPGMAGTPTGVPTNASAGYAPCVIDTTDTKLECYINGGWFHLTFTGGV